MIDAQRISGSFMWKGAALALLASVSPLAIAPAFAADAPSSGSGDTASSAPADIVVTATKRSESLQTVPISITAMTSEQLAQHQVASFDDYAKLLPSVSYQSFGPSQSQLYFRGITTGGDGVAVGPLPTVGLYVDETPLTTILNSVDLHVYDMARVEALAGPQGTLYGASSLSGTLRLITNKPVIGKWEGGIDLEGNMFTGGSGGGKAEGFVNIPLNDRMALRLVGYYEHDGGYISNSPGTRTYLRTHDDGTGNFVDSPYTVNNSKYAKDNFNKVDSAGGRAALKVDLDDNWTVTPMAVYQRQVSHGTFLFNDPANPNYSSGYVAGHGDLQVHDFTPDRNRDEWYLASMTIQGKLSDWDVTYAASYFDRRIDNTADYSYFSVAYDNLAKTDPADYAGYTYLQDSLGNDLDPTQVVHTYDKFSKFSQELRVSSPASDRLRLTAGLFMQRQTDRHIADYISPGVSTAVNAFSPQVPGAPTDDVYYTNVNRVDRDYAVFAEANYDIRRNLALTAGIRGFMADNTMFGFSGSSGAVDKAVLINGCSVATVFGCPNINKKYSEAGETHKVSLKWQIDPTRMVYFTYSTGFRPGGNNRDAYFNGKVQNYAPFAADRLTNYELGFKTSWFDHKLYVDGALFYEDWDKIQYSLPGILGIYYTVNAGTARSLGVEGQILWKMMKGLQLSANGTYVDAKLTSPFCDQVNGCDTANGGAVFAPSGTRLPVTPRVKLNATLRYETTLGAFGAFLQGGVNYQSGTTSALRTDWESIIGPTSGFTTTDFSGGIKRDKWSLSAYVTNAFDVRGILSKNLSCAPSVCGQYARLYPTKPREIGIRSSFRF